MGIESKFYNLDTFKKQIDVNFIDLDSELVYLNYKVASLIFCHFWRSIVKLSSGVGIKLNRFRLSYLVFLVTDSPSFRLYYIVVIG